MKKIIQEWLANPKRTYADGLAIFKTAAAPEIKKKYAEYFSSIENPEQFDIHFGMLINKVSDIDRKITLNPSAFKDLKLVLAAIPANNEAEIAAKECEIEALKATIDSLQTHKDDAHSENQELSEKSEELEQELLEKSEELEELETELAEKVAELEALKEQRGVQIVQYDNLPADIKKLYDCVKEITPIMASLHAEISVEGLHHSTRTKLVKKLVEFDDERRSAWDTIDEWAEGKTVEHDLELPAYSENEVVKGAEIARRIIRLKENITRSQDAADKADRETIKQSALKRVATYTAELAELEAIVSKPTDDKGAK